ncbi:MAG: divalent-cation tolerance protein CutA [Anaerolineales bacterium]|jgi:periplasmic divalent cation tolerance protein
MNDHLETEFCVALITAPSEEAARFITAELLAKKLAACVNLVSSVRSLYRWKGEICDDQEILMIVKCRKDSFEDRLVPAVKKIHPYKVPEIIALPIVKGAVDYLNWMVEVTADQDV